MTQTPATSSRQALLRPDLGPVKDTSLGNVSGPLVALLRVRHCPHLFIAGLLYDFARAGVAFLAPYYVNSQTQSAEWVQLVGSSSLVCLVAAPVLGVYADRFDRRGIMALSLAGALVTTTAAALLFVSGLLAWPLLFPYQVAFSAFTVLDMTSRPALICDILTSAGAERLVGVAMALRSVGFGLSRSLGNQVSGALVAAFGVGGAFLAVSAMLLLALLLLLRVPASKPRGSAGASGGAAVCRDLAAGLQLARTNAAFASMLGVTVIANFFWWSHTPLLQVLAVRLGATPLETGLLASASGYGALLATAVVALADPRAQGLLYCGGIGAAALLLPGAAAPSLGLAAALLASSGFFAGLFLAVQTGMVMAMVPEDMRGRAVGLQTMAIGALPLGMAALGALAERLGAPLALQEFALLGCAVEVLWLAILPQALWIRPDG